MSRSIHTIRRKVHQLMKAAASKTQGSSQELEKALTQINRKRSLKRAVRQERRLSHVPLPPTPLEDITIQVFDESEVVWHPAGPEDIQAILRILPESVRHGLTRIQLSLGIEVQVEKLLAGRESVEIDPFTGRPGVKIIPGVYSGMILGRYSSQSGVVSIFAYVVDGQQVKLPVPLCRVYLRLQALLTLVHELAHHHDKTARVRRGRWLADRKQNLESYAERMESEWGRQVVVPYLESQYPAEYKALLDWIEEHGGVRLNLAFFAGDPPESQRKGLVRFVFGATTAFESWLLESDQGSSPIDAHLSFAESLHLSEHYQECLQILDGILKVDGANVDALALKADTFVHLDRNDEAAAVVTTILNRQPDHERALEVKGDILEFNKEWQGLLENSLHILACTTPKALAYQFALAQQAVALCALGQLEKMDQVIQEYMKISPLKRSLEFWRKKICQRAGKP